MKLKGITASKGLVKARSLRVSDLTNLPAIPDSNYIVVAPYTTPAMNVILFTAKGIICETGGLTTHAAIIARELGIPCIMSVKDALNQIKNGQEIELNADTGEITIL
jgi:phosphohistidine swiveling domain-containing protein